MKNKRMFIIILTIGILVTVTYIFLSGEEKNVDYKIGMPDELDPGLIKFLLDESLLIDATLLESKENYTFSSFNHETQKMEYYSIPERQLADYLSPIINSDEPYQVKDDFKNNLVEDLFTSPAEQLGHFPRISMADKHILTITTDVEERTFDLTDELKDFNLTSEDEFSLEIHSANEEFFELRIINKSKEGKNKFLRVYLNQELTSFTAISSYIEEFNKQVEDGNLDEFKSLIFEFELNDEHILLNDHARVFNKSKNEVQTVNEEQDYLSEDGKYVYLNANNGSLTNGVQRIQKTEDYLDGNSTYYTEFEVDDKEIADQLYIDSSGISVENIVYFNEDYLVLFLEFSGPITGSTGETNIIIDFQDDKENPTYYLVDLNISM